MASSSAPRAVLRMRTSDSCAAEPLASASRPASRAMAAPDSSSPPWPRNARRAPGALVHASIARNDMMNLQWWEKSAVADRGAKPRHDAGHDANAADEIGNEAGTERVCE